MEPFGAFLAGAGLTFLAMWWRLIYLVERKRVILPGDSKK